jgi:hypothetical protein
VRQPESIERIADINKTNNLNSKYQMKTLSRLIGILTVVIIFSCSPDEENSKINNNSIKKLIQFTSDSYSYSNEQLTFNIIYDVNDNMSEVNFENGLPLQKYTYNSKNQIIKTEMFIYDNGLLEEKYEDVITYNLDSQITNIFTSSIYYNSDSSIRNQNTKTHKISYDTDLITVISDDPDNSNKAEYFLSDSLITRIKIYKGDSLGSNLSFEYDSKGNCILGTGPIGLATNYTPKTDDVELFISYETTEETPVYDSFLFQISLLTSFSFDEFRQILPKLGNRHSTEITWYQQAPDFFKQTYKYVYDNEGYIISKTEKTYGSNYLDERTETYTWK